LSIRKSLNNENLSVALTISLVLIVAAGMRFYGLHEIPFMHDEFSALFRTHYQSFGDLIRIGVMENDSHPAGVQVFLYYWVKLFGFNEFWIKLPFAILGVASVFLIYNIAKQWFGPLSALLSAAFFAGIQYAVFYSQIARPYAAGLFFVLLMVYFLNRWIKATQKISWTLILAFAIASWLAALMHAFSLASAGIIYLTGFFLIQRSHHRKYMVAGILAILFYLPHLPVFVYQLNAGGIGGWLGKPEAGFLCSFLFYTTNYSWFFVFILLAVFVLPFLTRQHTLSSKNTFRVVALMWFFIPLAVAWSYSLLRTPILQYSTLYFGFPFLVMIFFSFFQDNAFSANQKMLLTLVMLFVSSFTTIYERQHPLLMSEQGYDQIAQEIYQMKKKYPNQVSLASYSATPEMAAFYQDKLVPGTVKRFSKHHTLQEFGDWLNDQKTDILGFGWTDYAPVEWEFLAFWFYPNRNVHKAWFNAAWFESSRRTEDERFRVIQPLPDTEDQKFPNNLKYKIVHFDGSKSYGPAWNWNAEFWDTDVKVFALGALLLHDKPVTEARLVLEIKEKETDSLLFWQAGTVSNAWQKAEQTLLLSGFRFSNLKIEPKEVVIKAYIWNKAGETFRCVDVFYYKRDQHPFILGLVEPI
jgi:hypothetical protein